MIFAIYLSDFLSFLLADFGIRFVFDVNRLRIGRLFMHFRRVGSVGDNHRQRRGGRLSEIRREAFATGFDSMRAAQFRWKRLTHYHFRYMGHPNPAIVEFRWGWVE